jgi:hypothetical protein
MRSFGSLYYRAPRAIEALPGLSSEAKRCWAYIRFREYPDRPARIRQGGVNSFVTDLALPLRTIQRALRELRNHDPQLLIVHRHGTRNGGPSEYHAILPRERPPECCLHQAANLAFRKKSQPAKVGDTARHTGGLTGAKLAQCETATTAIAAACAGPPSTEKSNEQINEPGSPLAAVLENIRKNDFTWARSKDGFEGIIVAGNGRLAVRLATGTVLEVRVDRVAVWTFSKTQTNGQPAQVGTTFPANSPKAEGASHATS